LARLVALSALLATDAGALGGSAGTSAASFLELGFGARAVGMGEAFVAAADDPAAAHYNPAGLAFPASRAGGRPYELLLSQALLVQDVKMT
jgi:hypothetical protein